MFQLFVTHLQGYKLQAARAPFLITLEVLCELALPLVMAKIVDVAIPMGDTSYIFQLGAFMVFLSVIAMTAGIFATKYAAASSQGFGGNLRQSLFDKVQEFSFGDIDRFSSASLITRMTNDVNAMTTMLSMGLRVLVRAPAMLIVAMGVCLYLNAQLAIVLIVTIPILILFVGLVMKMCIPLFKITQTKIDGLNNTVQENLVAVRVVKAFVTQNQERKKFKTANDELSQASLNVGIRIVLMFPLIMLCLNGATIAVLFFGGPMVMDGSFAVGNLVAFLNYIMQVLMSVMMMGMTLLQLSRSQACATRILEVLNAEPSIQNKAGAETRTLPAAQGEVEFQNVSFRYQTEGEGDDVLANISLHIKPGQFVALVGGTGTGKSSLVNLIPRFYDVTSGAVLVDGMDVRDYPIEGLRSRIGMVLQSNVLFTGTVKENLLWGDSDATQEEMIQAAKDAQAYDFIMSLEDGFDSLLDQGGVNLSGGQKQRLCIARAMLKKPAILILDDSTSAVDSTTEAAIRESFHNNLKGTTIIMIAQRISSVQYADAILILDDDHIAGYGDHETLLAENKIYQEIYQSQQEGVAQ